MADLKAGGFGIELEFLIPWMMRNKGSVCVSESLYISVKKEYRIFIYTAYVMSSN